MKKCILLVLTVSLLTSFPLLSYAQDSSDRPNLSKPFMKLGRGIVNVISSPLEIPNQMYLLSDHANQNSKYRIKTGAVAIEGFFIGIVYTFWRLGAGAYDFFTFPFPDYDFCYITPPYLTISYQEYYGKEEEEVPAE